MKNKMYILGESRQDYAWLNEDSRTFLQRGYIENGKTAEVRIREIAEHAEKILKMKGFADKFEYYMKRGFFSLSSPVWANFGTDKGLPISCFGSYIPDSTSGILDTVAEVGMMSKFGGGTSAYFGHIRPRGSIIRNNGKTDGSFNFAKLFDSTISVISQGASRRGMFAGYIDIDHGDVLEWLDIHTEGNPIQQMYYGVCVNSRWLDEARNGDLQKQKIWGKILKRKKETGIPYILFTDNANNGRPDVYKDKNMNILASNLCSEIMLPSKIDESFVCCLGSINLLYFNEWKDTDAPEILTFFLDALMEEFITKTEGVKHMERPHRFAKNHRALGVGVLGWHSYLQSEMIPFDSQKAMEKTQEIFELLQRKTLAASKELAKLLGEPEVLKGYGRRNTTLMAIAPTKSSSAILGGVSPSIEPLKSNYFVKDLAKIMITQRNVFLEKVLESHNMNTQEVWEDIMLHDGSVQHLKFLTQNERDVFKTFAEIDVDLLVEQAALRQKFIDQGQSLNLMFHPTVTPKEINRIYLKAHDLGIKAIYYQMGMNASQAFSRTIQTKAAAAKSETNETSEIPGVQEATCSSCEA